ncbi:MAG: hypothetical protein VKM01_05110 [Cyanobacteriota bacterium]|nr:hypothetical protein [Cyanobacteriota bacterium]
MLRGILSSNEPGKLALAHQQVNPAWLPDDWYLTTSQSYQWLFQQITGTLVLALGDPLAAMVIRLIGYVGWSLALARVALQLQLSPLLTTLAAVLFVQEQSVIAGEWMVGSAEPKTFAYAALLMAFALWRERRWAWCGLLLALACSFHLLVGVFGAAALGLLALARHRGHWNPGAWRRGALAAAIPALPLGLTLIEQVGGRGGAVAAGVGEPSANFIYVYLRNPHHLVPASWTAGAWLEAALVLLLFSGAAVLCLRAGERRPGFPATACTDLILWTLAAALFGLLGLLISPIDRDGTVLKLYLFRVPDTLVVLASWLLLLRWLPPRAARGWPAALLVLVLVVRGAPWARAFPAAVAQRFIASPEQAELYGWLRDLPGHGSLVITPPAGFEDLSNHTRKPRLVQFKQVPTASGAILSWYRRLTALAGGDPQVWQGPGGTPAQQRLERAYDGLDGAALARLAEGQRAGVVVTRAERPGPEGWRRAFANDRWWGWLPPTGAADGHSGEP